MNIHKSVSGSQRGSDLSFVFANSSVVNTQLTATLTKNSQNLVDHKFIVHNPSTVSDLTIKFFDIESSLGGAEREAYVTSVTVPKASTTTGTAIDTYSVIVEGLFTGDSVKVVASNNTALGATDGFTATIRVREV